MKVSPMTRRSPRSRHSAGRRDKPTAGRRDPPAAPVSAPLQSASAEGTALRRLGRARQTILRGTIAEALQGQFRFAELPLGDGIAPVGMALAVLVPRRRFVEFGLDFRRTAGRGIAQRRPGQAANGDLDRGAAAMEWLQRKLAALDDGAIDAIRIGARRKSYQQPVDAQLAIERGRALYRPWRVAADTAARPFLGQTVGALEEPSVSSR